MEANNKEKIKRCLTCPVGHRVIGDFFSLYPVWVGQQKERHKATDDENDYIHSLASSISSTLLLHSTPSNNLDFIISFAESSKKFDKNIKKSNLANIDNSCCLYALNNILYPIKVILEEQTDFIGDSIRDELSKKGIDIILIMNEVLEDNALFTDFDLTTEEKRWTKEYRGSLSLEQAKEIYKKLRAILSKYCLTSDKNIKYKYCNPIYSDKTTEIEYKGQVYRSCQSEDFEKYINSIKSYYSIDSDWKGLTDNNVRIIQQYLIDSPKRFGALLTRVMDYQGLTSQKIVKIWAYDFRHNYATTNINSWKEKGFDIITNLYYLSKNMGHSSIEHTKYYYSMVPHFAEILEEKSSAAFDELMPEVKEYEEW